MSEPPPVPPVVEVDAWMIALVPRFLDNRRKDVAALKAAVASADRAAVAAIGHRLKGDAGSYGFTTLAEIGARIERAAYGRELTAARECAGEIATYIASVQVVCRDRPVGT